MVIRVAQVSEAWNGSGLHPVESLQGSRAQVASLFVALCLVPCQVLEEVGRRTQQDLWAFTWAVIDAVCPEYKETLMMFGPQAPPSVPTPSAAVSAASVSSSDAPTLPSTTPALAVASESSKTSPVKDDPSGDVAVDASAVAVMHGVTPPPHIHAPPPADAVVTVADENGAAADDVQDADDVAIAVGPADFSWSVSGRRGRAVPCGCGVATAGACA